MTMGLFDRLFGKKKPAVQEEQVVEDQLLDQLEELAETSQDQVLNDPLLAAEVGETVQPADLVDNQEPVVFEEPAAPIDGEHRDQSAYGVDLGQEGIAEADEPLEHQVVLEESQAVESVAETGVDASEEPTDQLVEETLALGEVVGQSSQEIATEVEEALEPVEGETLDSTFQEAADELESSDQTGSVASDLSASSQHFSDLMADYYAKKAAVQAAFFVVGSVDPLEHHGGAAGDVDLEAKPPALL
jgi:fused signal recognition particle receptor